MSFDRAFARTYAAWERFVSGEGDACDVPLSIALSWHRCRDVHRIDPRRARPAPVEGRSPAREVHGRVLAELGALATTLLTAEEDCLVSVSDGTGAVVATWGKGSAGRRAPVAGLHPSVAWPEAVTGTNAIGTSIVQRRVCTVRGPEHWGTALHEWSCTGVALSDPITAASIATLTVASWRAPVPVRPIDLLLATEPVATALQDAATRQGRRILDAFADLERRTSGVLVALDLRGRIVAANPAARRRGAVPGDYALESPTARHDLRSLGHVLPEVGERARHDPGWRGTVSLWSALTDDDETYRVLPVLAGGDPIAFLACTDARAGRGEALDAPTGPAPCRPAARRVPAVGSGGQIVVLHPGEIRHARADGHSVWLATDHGPLRATGRGIDHVERDLADLGFLRVHRSYLVNIGRIRDVTPHKDRLVISTAPDEGEQIPVSRRYVPAVRRVLGL